MSAALPLILQVALTIAWAIVQAWVHARIIREKRMRHSIKRWWTGARFVATTLLFVVSFLFISTWISILAMWAGWVLFPVLFNTMLNHRMGWHPLYLGSTSDTDLFIISTWMEEPSWKIAQTHDWRYNNTAYRRAVHAAAACFYGLALVLAAILAWLSLIINPNP